jgi:hypothetical protein
VLRNLIGGKTTNFEIIQDKFNFDSGMNVHQLCGNGLFNYKKNWCTISCIKWTNFKCHKIVRENFFLSTFLLDHISVCSTGCLSVAYFLVTISPRKLKFWLRNPGNSLDQDLLPEKYTFSNMTGVPAIQISHKRARRWFLVGSRWSSRLVSYSLWWYSNDQKFCVDDGPTQDSQFWANVIKNT